MFSLNNYIELDQKLFSLFQSDILKLGVSFEGDLQMLNKSYPHLTSFFKPFVNYIDIISIFRKMNGFSPGGLSGMCEYLLGKNLSKFEQMSD